MTGVTAKSSLSRLLLGCLARRCSDRRIQVCLCFSDSPACTAACGIGLQPSLPQRHCGDAKHSVEN